MPLSPSIDAVMTVLPSKSPLADPVTESIEATSGLLEDQETVLPERISPSAFFAMAVNCICPPIRISVAAEVTPTLNTL